MALFRLNGHEDLKRQLVRKALVFTALDDGLLSCEDPAAAQGLAAGLDVERTERFFRKWLKILPHPYPAADRKAGCRYQLSMLQAEFSLTQVRQRPLPNPHRGRPPPHLCPYWLPVLHCGRHIHRGRRAH